MSRRDADQILEQVRDQLGLNDQPDGAYRREDLIEDLENWEISRQQAFGPPNEDGDHPDTNWTRVHETEDEAVNLLELVSKMLKAGRL